MITDIAALRSAFSEALIPIYGREALERADTVLPAFMADFFQMLQRAPLGSMVEETYKTEDMKVTLHLKGTRAGTGGNDGPVLLLVRCNEAVIFEQNP